METYAQKYYREHKEKLLAYAKKYRATHKEQQRRMQRVWRKAHPEKKKEYRKKHAKSQKAYYEKWYEENGRNRAENYREKVLEYEQQFPKRIKIQRQLSWVIKKGEITRPSICPQCSRKAIIQAHHYNYDHYMNFIWLCASCHKKEHLVGKST